MTGLTLERLSFLLVDDNAFALRLITSILHKLGVGTVLTAKNGVEAVHILKGVAQDPMKYGVQSIDAVIADWVMPQVDGAMLLRWIRRHPDSPNRFMPFVMFSGMADEDMVNEARFLGVNEFVAKPFSIESVVEKIQNMINKPRRFVYNYDYFGPDRRRQNLKYEGPEKRIMKAEDTEVVYTGKNPATLSKKPKVWFFELPNRLKEMTMSLGEKGEVAIFDPALLQVAEQQIQSLEEDYVDWIRENMSRMFELYDKIDLKMEQSEVIRVLKKINDLSHDIRGQGTTFGYPLITEFNQSLFECTRFYDQIDTNLVELVKAHMDAIRAVMRERVKDMGGELGQSIIQGLDKAKQKYRNKGQK